MRKLIVVLAFIPALSMAGEYNRYDYHGSDRYYQPRVIQIDPVQQMQIRQQQERAYRLQEDTAVRQGLKDAWRDGDRPRYDRY